VASASRQRPPRDGDGRGDRRPRGEDAAEEMVDQVEGAEDTGADEDGEA
jgi:hypothetical protein